MLLLVFMGKFNTSRTIKGKNYYPLGMIGRIIKKA